MKKFFLLLLTVVLGTAVLADEGMWIPMLLGKNEAAMKKAGMRISAKDIYDVNHASLKDAVVLFGGGCTGEFVSNEGLLLTNHHCGYYYITSHSTVEHDYLTNGFWAMNRDQELPCPGLSVTRLVRMEDVTEQVLRGTNNQMPDSEREKIIEKNIKSVGDAAVRGTHYKYVIKPFYYGNQYFMYINEVFTDVRLAGAPPSNIGKFGGDTDNWMWPRHTGDFSMFRVYASPSGKPADYSADNVPYRPLKAMTISLKGVDQGDFTFVFGYPGTTNRYVTSDAVAMTVEQDDPICIDLRDIRLRHYKNAQEQSAAQRLRYASKVASIANGWKKWQGEIQGIERLKGIEQKVAFEREYQQWANSRPEYINVQANLHKQYNMLRPIRERMVYMNEAVMASDFMNIAYQMWRATNVADNADQYGKLISSTLSSAESYYKDFANHSAVDRSIFVETMMYARKHGMKFYKPEMSDSQFEAELYRIYSKSVISQPTKMRKMLQTSDASKLNKQMLADPAVQLFDAAYNYFYDGESLAKMREAQGEINRLMRTYVKGMMEMYPDSNFFPDANLTLRVTYGHVDGFHPRDGVVYKPYSTLEGIMEKENPDIYDYVVEKRLKELYQMKDYGRYANAKGEMPVAFIATNHTTGGNSGSPVLNADGQLVGINFDRCWEGTMSDLLFDPDYCRNISLDIRYCLFIIDKFAGAQHLVKEMNIVK